MGDGRWVIGDWRLFDWGEIVIRPAAHLLRLGCFAFGLHAKTMIGPVSDQPFHVLGDRVHVFDVFFRRVGVVHPKVADAAEFAGNAEIQANALGVPDVEITIRFGRKTRMNLFVLPGGQIGRDDIPDKIGRNHFPRRLAALPVRNGTGNHILRTGFVCLGFRFDHDFDARIFGCERTKRALG